MDTPTETLFLQIDDAVQYANKGNSPFTNTQVCIKAYLNVANTGHKETPAQYIFAEIVQ